MNPHSLGCISGMHKHAASLKRLLTFNNHAVYRLIPRDPSGKDEGRMQLPIQAAQGGPYKDIHSFITRFPIRRSGALQQTFYGGSPACPVLGFPPPCN